MCFSVEKCKIMHTFDDNPNFNYVMHGNERKKIIHYEDVGISIGNTYKMSDQFTAASKKAIMMLGLI